MDRKEGAEMECVTTTTPAQEIEGIDQQIAYIKVYAYLRAVEGLLPVQDQTRLAPAYANVHRFEYASGDGAE
jgi:hypothetical protein